MQDLWIANVIQWIMITRTFGGLILLKSHYNENILDKFDKNNDGVEKIHVDVNLHLSKNTREGISQLQYSHIIGRLMYLMDCTRPDITYAVSKLSRFTSNPGENHWKAIVKVLRYLRYTKEYGLYYTNDPDVVEGYCDATWISDSKDSKSTSGYVFIIGSTAVS